MCARLQSSRPKNIAGVKEVHDHLCYVDTYSGFYVELPEDMKAAS